MRWSYVVIVSFLITGFWGPPMDAETMNRPDSCIAVRMKDALDILYFKDGEVEVNYGKYYCIFKRFDGSTVRFEHDAIASMKDVPLTDAVWAAIEQQQKACISDTSQISGILSVESLTKPAALSILPTEDKPPETSQDEKEKEDEDELDLTQIDNQLIRDQIQRKLDKVKALRAEARHEMNLSLKPYSIVQSYRRYTKWPDPDITKIKALLTKASDLKLEAENQVRQFLKKHESMSPFPDPAESTADTNPFYAPQIAKKLAKAAVLREEADLWTLRIDYMQKQSKLEHAADAQARKTKLLDRATALDLEVKEIRDQYAKNRPPGLKEEIAPPPESNRGRAKK